MLKSLKLVRKGIEGINPDLPLKEAELAEKTWIMAKQGGDSKAKEMKDLPRTIAEKKHNLVNQRNTSDRKRKGVK